MVAVSEESASGDRGPNGFPYLDTERTRVGAWENGEFNLQLRREDGESLTVNLTPDQLVALEDGLYHTREEAIEDQEVDFHGV